MVMTAIVTLVPATTLMEAQKSAVSLGIIREMFSGDNNVTVKGGQGLITFDDSYLEKAQQIINKNVHGCYLYVVR